MKLDIPYYIRQVLREKRMVSIPGIGTFNLEQEPSNFNDDKTILSPPQLKLTFNDNETGDDSLLRYILDTGLLTPEKAQKRIDKFTQDAFNSLINVDSFLIDGVGTIFKKDGQEKVSFEPDISRLTKEFEHLPAINLVPISRIAEQPVAASYVAPPPADDESGSILSRILLFTLLLIALYFLGTYLVDKFSNDADRIEIGVVESTKDISNVEMASIDSSDRELEEKYEEIDDLIDTKNQEEGEGKGKIATATENDKAAASITEIPESSSESVKGITKDKNTAIAKNKSTKTVDTTNVEKSNNKHADIIPATGKCIIVVGSFKKATNVVKMVSLLESKGYEVHRSIHNGFTRVGLVYECMDEDLENFLQNIRKKISGKAWYLDPELEVPYNQ